MQNGYFRLVNDFEGFGIALYPPKDFGEAIREEELWKYLDGLHINYDRKKIALRLEMDGAGICHLGEGTCPVCNETYELEIKDNAMLVTARFYPPSETGKRLDLRQFRQELARQNISSGIEESSLKAHFENEGTFCTDILVAKGKRPKPGQDARIEYNFNTSTHKRPTHLPDGRVDFYNLTSINQCSEGDVLARIIPEQQGESGTDVYGKVIKAPEVKRETLKFGKNVEISEDKLSLKALVDGHVSLIDNKVSVESVYRVKDVDVSTGNIVYNGSVEISGNVEENFKVKAGGNVVISGSVGGATIIAGGNIIIAKGMNGMGKGYLRAGGDVMVKFLENSRVVTGGFLETEAILHCTVSVGMDVKVEGRKGIILGGRIQAAKSIRANIIGGSMSTATTLEVGVDPVLRTQLENVSSAIEEKNKTFDAAQVIFNNFKEKQKKGVKYNENQLRYMKSVLALIQEKTKELEQLSTRQEELKAMIETREEAEVAVNDQLYPNTTIIIGNVSRLMQSNYRHCKFVKEEGEVRMVNL